MSPAQLDALAALVTAPFVLALLVLIVAACAYVWLCERRARRLSSRRAMVDTRHPHHTPGGTRAPNA